MDKPIIGIIGLGTMGLGITQVFAQAGHRVLATDQFALARTSAIERMAASLAPRVTAGKMSSAEVGEITSRIDIVQTPEEMRGVSLAIEAIAEDLTVKHDLFETLETCLAPNVVFATNTSSLSVATIAHGLKHPGRVVGLHFFNPAPVMKLVELIIPPGVTSEALSTARAIVEGTGKTVIAAADTPGFIVNRCARPYYGEALALLEEGHTALEIDAAMMAAGYRLGPFALIDLVGADINLAATQHLNATMGGNPRYHIFESLRSQVARGDLGRKTGRGFVFPAEVPAPPANASAIVLRIEAALANEAASLLDAGVSDANSIDMALRLGLNFPRGPFEAARAQGLPRIRAALIAQGAKAPAHLKGRYSISPKLESME